MGYSRVGSQSLCRASRTWTYAGSAGAGSTCLPSFGLLGNAAEILPELVKRGVRPDTALVIRALRD